MLVETSLFAENNTAWWLTIALLLAGSQHSTIVYNMIDGVDDRINTSVPRRLQQ